MTRKRAPGRAVTSAAALATILSLSCATPIRLSTSIDPLSLLAADCLAYARVSGSVARDLAPDFLGAPGAAAAKEILARTRIVALGLGQSGGGGEDSLQAILVGDYPFRAASLSLGASREWKREKASFYNERFGLRAAVLGPSLVVASKGPIEGLIEAAATAQASGAVPSPIPPRLSGLDSAELVLWVPDPFKSLEGETDGEGASMPTRGLLIAASPSAADKGEYVAVVAFLMDGPESVKIYKPLLRLAWYAIASEYLSDDTGAVPRANFAANGEVYAAEGVVLPRGAIVRALRLSVGSGLGALGRGVGPGQ